MSFAQALGQLLRGPQQQADYSDVVNRCQTGHPSEGYDDQKVLRRYGQIAPQLPPQEYQHAAMAAQGFLGSHGGGGGGLLGGGLGGPRL